MARPFLLLAAFLALGTLPARAEPPAAPAAKGDADAAEVDFQNRVNAGIDRGAAWLKKQQRPDGGYPGFDESLKPNTYNPMNVGVNALVIHTLAHCGVPAEDDAVKKCLRFCQFHYAGGNGSWNLKGNGKVYVYIAATLIMALDAMFVPGVEKDAPVKKDRYGNPIPPSKPPTKCKYPEQMRKWIEELVDTIVKAQVTPDGGWRYPGNPVGSVDGTMDLSNTQYALLALDTAARCGIDVPEAVWTRAAEFVLKEQEEEGVEAPVWVEREEWKPGDDAATRFREAAKAQARGWTYLCGHGEPSTGAMTCAGVTCLGLVKERLWARSKLTPELSRRLDKGMLDGITWLSEHFTVEDNPDPPSQWHYYYLYGLERTGAKVGVKFVGQHDWYHEGAEHLLAAQDKEGGWAEAKMSNKPADNSESAITQTCFALLFLKRATRAPSVPMTPPVLTGTGEAPKDNR